MRLKTAIIEQLNTASMRLNTAMEELNAVLM
jgi:hypothetical protein